MLREPVTSDTYEASPNNVMLRNAAQDNVFVRPGGPTLAPHFKCDERYAPGARGG